MNGREVWERVSITFSHYAIKVISSIHRVCVDVGTPRTCQQHVRTGKQLSNEYATAIPEYILVSSVVGNVGSFVSARRNGGEHETVSTDRIDLGNGGEGVICDRDPHTPRKLPRFQIES